MEPSKREADQEVANRIRAHHFNFGTKPPDYTSVSEDQFNFKGNPQHIMGTLDEARKKDLRASHFEMGSHKNDFISEKNKQDA